MQIHTDTCNEHLIPVKKPDRMLALFVMRFWAIVAFIASLPSIGSGLFIIPTALFPGMVLLLLGVFFIWAGIRAWKDNSTLGDVLNRDFEPAGKTVSNGKPDN